MSELDNITTASSGESMLLAAQALPTSSPINVVSTASIVPAPTASQFSRELEGGKGTCKLKRRAEVSHIGYNP